MVIKIMTNKLNENKLLNSLPERKPSWLKVKIPSSKSYFTLRDMMKEKKLSTVCQEALCPNIEECWSSGTATFMLMGDTCTRACKFCAVKTGNPAGILDINEPSEVASSVELMKLKYVVLTSVDRDDLNDLGSIHFAKTIKEIKINTPQCMVECLTPDFNAEKSFIKNVLDSNPDVFAHNVETVQRLSSLARDRRASYKTTLKTLATVKEINSNQYTKTSVMLGLGETIDEVYQTMKDLRDIDVDVITFGQYLSPTSFHKKYLPVKEYVKPEVFEQLKKTAYDMGFMYCASGPLVRSSYKAAEQFLYGKLKDKSLENVRV